MSVLAEARMTPQNARTKFVSNC